MKVVILNSGLGRRLLPYTKTTPKCLLKIGRKSILENQLDTLTEQGLKDFVITTGPFEDQIRNLVSSQYPGINVEYYHNEKYDETNYIYSLWIARKALDEEIILLHGDLIFEPSLLIKLLETNEGNFVLVNKTIPPPEKDFKAHIENNFVKSIGVDIFGENTYFCAPLYRLTKSAIIIWMKEIENFVQIGKTREYAENAFNIISDKIGLIPLYYSLEFCMEIDSKEDLDIVNDYLLKKPTYSV